MNVLVTGASGLVGAALMDALRARGDRPTALARPFASDGDPSWDPARGLISLEGLRGLDAVVHLAGESIADGRWTRRKRARILSSRVEGTRLLCEHLAELERRPRVLVSASAIGFYGDRGSDFIDESSPPGEGFLAEVCKAWEAATVSAEACGIRVVHARLGVVLSRSGGVLRAARIPFLLGLGGALGRGRQFMSWVSLEDVVAMVLFALENEAVKGAVNFVGPEPVTNRKFARTLGHVLHRPAVCPAPAAVLRAVLGEMADELLLASIRVKPFALTEAGYTFRHTTLEEALAQVLRCRHSG